MSLLNLSLIFGILSAVVSCGFDITEVHPHQLDPTRGYARIYEFYKVKPAKCGDPDFDVRYTGEKKPISEMSGYSCFPTDEVQYVYGKFLEHNRKKVKCVAEETRSNQ